MWFINGDRTELINTEYAERFVTVKKDDAVLIVVSYGERCKTIGRYCNETDAGIALTELFEAISEGKKAYFMNSSTGCIEPPQEQGYHGKKPKRRGGS